jgi:hypothetical protein
LLINIILNEICVEFQEKRSFTDGLYNDTMCIDIKRRRPMEMPNLRVLVSKIREQVINKLSLSLSLSVCVCVETYVSDFLIWCIRHFSQIIAICFFFFIS